MKRNWRLAIATLTLCVLAGIGVAQDAGRAPQVGAPGQPGREGRPPVSSPVITALDANGDGTIDAGEIAKAAESLAKLDQNKDGRLAPDELRPRTEGRPPGGGPGRAPQASSIFTSSPQAKSDTEKKILSVLADMSANQRRGSMSVPDDDGRILRVLAESLGAKHVVEIGTSIGYSGMWFCLGLQQTGGKLTTFEIDSGRAATARENFKRAGVDGLVTLVEGDAHETVKKLKDPIDLLFLDADKEGYLDYLEKLLPLLRPGGLVVAHNINPRQADPRYLKAVTTNRALETLFLNLETSGIAVTLKKR